MSASAAAAFRAVVIDHRGVVSTTTIEAENLEQARQRAASRGETVLRCDAVMSSSAPGGWWRKLRLPAAGQLDTSTFSQDLATLLEAGLTVKDSVAALCMQERSAARRQVLSRLNDAMAEGLSFSAALARAGVFSELLVATVLASEQTGDLATGLARYARHQERIGAIRERVIGACVYPLLLLLVGAFVVAILLGVVVPRFAMLIDVQSRDLPALSKLLIGWGQFANANPAAPMVLLAVFAALIVAGLLQLRAPGTRRRLLAWMPGVARVVRQFEHLQMYRTTAILTSRGLPVHRALALSGELLNPLDAQLLQAGLVRMREGAGMSEALASCGLCDGVAASMLGVAERSGALPQMLDRIADFHERGLQRSIDLASRLLEPLLMIVLGGVIGGIVVLMYLPIFDLAASVG